MKTCTKNFLIKWAALQFGLLVSVGCRLNQSTPAAKSEMTAVIKKSDGSQSRVALISIFRHENGNFSSIPENKEGANFTCVYEVKWRVVDNPEPKLVINSQESINHHAIKTKARTNDRKVFDEAFGNSLPQSDYKVLVASYDHRSVVLVGDSNKDKAGWQGAINAIRVEDATDWNSKVKCPAKFFSMSNQSHFKFFRKLSSISIGQ